MEKIYDVSVTMLSVISSDDAPSGGDDRNESSYSGKLEVLDDKLLITYSERTEGGVMNTEIHVFDGKVIVKRRGAIVSEMVFAEGERYTSLYTIPPHSFDMVIDCRRLKIQTSDREGRVDMLYKMEIGGEARSARMRITWN